MTSGDEAPGGSVAALFAGGLVEALHALVGDKPEVVWLPAAARDLPESGVRWSRHDLSIGRESSVSCGAAEADWSALAEQILRAAGIEESDPQTNWDTYTEASSQAAAAVAAKLTAASGNEVNCRPSAEAAPPVAAVLFRVELSFGGAPKLLLYVALSTGLLDATAPPAPQAAGPESQAPAPLTSKTLNVLLDLEVPIRVLFGSAHVPLSELLKLATGSIVELDRQISEPVEIVVNNCVIARGEVVVIEGNYGVRINEIISRRDRLMSTEDSWAAAQRRATAGVIS